MKRLIKDPMTGSFKVKSSVKAISLTSKGKTYRERKDDFGGMF
jgi:hypothetical protein